MLGIADMQGRTDLVVGMKGATTGLTYGPVVLQKVWNSGERVYCAYFYPRPNSSTDSGAPVFVHYGNQVLAAGVYVGRTGPYDCFVPLADLLQFHNAWLP